MSDHADAQAAARRTQRSCPRAYRRAHQRGRKLRAEGCLELADICIHLRSEGACFCSARLVPFASNGLMQETNVRRGDPGFPVMVKERTRITVLEWLRRAPQILRESQELLDEVLTQHRIALGEAH